VHRGGRSKGDVAGKREGRREKIERGRLSLPLFASSLPLLRYALSQGIVEAPRGN